MEEEVEVDYSPDDEPTQEVAPEIAEDIYSDLYDAQGEKGTLLKAKYAALQEQCHGQEATINKLRGRIEELLDVNTVLTDERKILIRNISCIYRTAKEEIARKNEELNKRASTIISMREENRSHPRGNAQQPFAAQRMHAAPPSMAPPLPHLPPPRPPPAPPPM